MEMFAARWDFYVTLGMRHIDFLRFSEKGSFVTLNKIPSKLLFNLIFVAEFLQKVSSSFEGFVQTLLS